MRRVGGTTRAIEIKSQISEAAADFNGHHEFGLREIRRLKTRINELEHSLSEKGDDRTQDVSRLERATEELDNLIDSIILRSEKQWDRFHELENASESRVQASYELNELRTICERTEALAKDLLCYSLGRFRKTSR